MSTFPQISEAEFEVMKIVWKYAPINTNEITEKLLPTTNWSPKTIQTAKHSHYNADKKSTPKKAVVNTIDCLSLPHIHISHHRKKYSCCQHENQTAPKEFIFF